MPKYDLYKWEVKSHWKSGAVSFDTVYIALPDIEHARSFIQAHVNRFYPINDVRLATCVTFQMVIKNKETLPAAYRADDESVWNEYSVNSYYPEIMAYWWDKGFRDIRISPCGPVDEDCLYLNGKWKSYCRHPYEWMQPEDLFDELKPPVAKQRRRNCTV